VPAVNIEPPAHVLVQRDLGNHRIRGLSDSNKTKAALVKTGLELSETQFAEIVGFITQISNKAMESRGDIGIASDLKTTTEVLEVLIEGIPRGTTKFAIVQQLLQITGLEGDTNFSDLFNMTNPKSALSDTSGHESSVQSARVMKLPLTDSLFAYIKGAGDHADTIQWYMRAQWAENYAMEIVSNKKMRLLLELCAVLDMDRMLVQKTMQLLFKQAVADEKKATTVVGVHVSGLKFANGKPVEIPYTSNDSRMTVYANHLDDYPGMQGGSGKLQLKLGTAGSLLTIPVDVRRRLNMDTRQTVAKALQNAKEQRILSQVAASRSDCKLTRRLESCVEIVLTDEGKKLWYSANHTQEQKEQLVADSLGGVMRGVVGSLLPCNLESGRTPTKAKESTMIYINECAEDSSIAERMVDTLQHGFIPRQPNNMYIQLIKSKGPATVSELTACKDPLTPLSDDIMERRLEVHMYNVGPITFPTITSNGQTLQIKGKPDRPQTTIEELGPVVDRPTGTPQDFRRALKARDGEISMATFLSAVQRLKDERAIRLSKLTREGEADEYLLEHVKYMAQVSDAPQPMQVDDLAANPAGGGM
jgi:hypothetical protein